MNKIKKYFLPVLLGAMITVPTVSAFAEGVTDSTTFRKSMKVENRQFNKVRENEGAKAVKKFNMNITEDQRALLDEIREQVQNGTITKEEAKAKIEATGIQLPERKGPAIKLTEEQKELVSQLREKLKNEEITKEEFVQKLKDAGIEGMRAKMKHKFQENLTEEQKTLLNEIREQVKNGTITKEEAKSKIEAAGIQLPERKGPDVKLTEEQKALISELKEQLKNEEITKQEFLQKLKDTGIKGMGERIKHKFHENLTEEQKTLLQEIKVQVKNGTITKEEASQLIKDILNK